MIPYHITLPFMFYITPRTLGRFFTFVFRLEFPHRNFLIFSVCPFAVLINFQMYIIQFSTLPLAVDVLRASSVKVSVSVHYFSSLKSIQLGHDLSIYNFILAFCSLFCLIIIITRGSIQAYCYICILIRTPVVKYHIRKIKKFLERN